MSIPKAPAPGTTAIVCGDMVTATDRGDRMPLYEVRSMSGGRVVHWCWDAIIQICWGWPSPTEMGRTEVRAWRAGRFGRGRTVFHVDGEDLEIEHWASVGDWNVVLFFEGGRRIQVDRHDRIVSDSANEPHRITGSVSRPDEPCLAPDPVLDPDTVKTRAMLAGEAPSGQISLFGGAS